MSCARKHTKYQPTNEEFKCPRCGATPDTDPQFVQEPPEDVWGSMDDSCDKLHDDDMCNCNRCEYGVSGKGFAARLAKQHKLVPCPHCRGTGLVKKEGT
jgi:hypothetical protein